MESVGGSGIVVFLDVLLVVVVGDVVFGLFFCWVGEQCIGVVEFDQFVYVYECCIVGNLCGLLYVVGNDDDGEF